MVAGVDYERQEIFMCENRKFSFPRKRLIPADDVTLPPGRFLA
jgi:hypothetical protein